MNYNRKYYPFSSVEAYHSKHNFIKVKGKELVGDEDVPVSVLIRHPLTGFIRPVTSLECGTIDTYHRFEVPKKGDDGRPITFHTLGDKDKHGKQKQ